MYGVARGDQAVQGHRVGPGDYLLRLHRGDAVTERTLTVRWDPVNDYDPARIREQQRMLEEIGGMVAGIYRRIQTLTAIRRQAELRKEFAEATGDEDAVAAAEALLEALDDWQSSVTTPERKTFQDVLNFAPRIDAFLVDLYQQVDGAVLGLTEGQRARYADLEASWTDGVGAGWDALMAEQITPFIERGGPVLYVPEWEDAAPAMEPGAL